MAKGWNGSVLGATNSPNGVSTSGVFSLNELFRARKENTWPGLPYVLDFLLVAGGGSGDNGAGGAGGVRQIGFMAGAGNTYPVVIGAGGTWGGPNLGTNGSDSTFAGYTAAGGGAGRYSVAAGNGGSGGGGNHVVSAPGSGNSPATIPVQGYDGGFGGTNSGGGGGGASAKGSDAVAGDGGNGGDGIDWKGLGTYYGGGGGGGTDSSTPGTGGLGGGGNGAGSSVPNPGEPNTGGGCGGSYMYGGGATSIGGSGICIIRYAGVQRGTGGTYVYDAINDYSYHTFTGDGNYVA